MARAECHEKWNELRDLPEPQRNTQKEKKERAPLQNFQQASRHETAHALTPTRSQCKQARIAYESIRYGRRARSDELERRDNSSTQPCEARVNREIAPPAANRTIEQNVEHRARRKNL